MQKTSVKILISIAGSFAGAVLEMLYVTMIYSWGDKISGLGVFSFLPRIITSLILSFTVWKDRKRKFAIGVVIFIVSGIIEWVLMIIWAYWLLVNMEF